MSCTAESAMRSASWSESLTGKLQQTQNVNPQRGHEMPAPCAHYPGTPPSRHRAAQQRSDARNEQGENPAHQVTGVSARQQIDKRATGRGGYIETVCSQLPPGRPLAEKKSETKDESHR